MAWTPDHCLAGLLWIQLLQAHGAEYLVRVADPVVTLAVRCCRDAEVLSLFAAIINKLAGKMQTEVPRIFEAVFECTLQMITVNFEVRFLLSSSHPDPIQPCLGSCELPGAVMGQKYGASGS